MFIILTVTAYLRDKYMATDTKSILLIIRSATERIGHKTLCSFLYFFTSDIRIIKPSRTLLYLI